MDKGTARLYTSINSILRVPWLFVLHDFSLQNFVLCKKEKTLIISRHAMRKDNVFANIMCFSTIAMNSFLRSKNMKYCRLSQYQ